jgi:hypothetical protein
MISLLLFATSIFAVVYALTINKLLNIPKRPRRRRRRRKSSSRADLRAQSGTGSESGNGENGGIHPGGV